MNAYNRLTKLIVYMSDEKFQATIPNLAKAMGVYERQVEEDINYLLSFECPKGKPFFKPHISISETDNGTCYRIKSIMFMRGEKQGKKQEEKLFFLTPIQFRLYDLFVVSKIETADFEDFDLLEEYLEMPVTIIDEQYQLDSVWSFSAENLDAVTDEEPEYVRLGIYGDGTGTIKIAKKGQKNQLSISQKNKMMQIRFIKNKFKSR